MTDTEQRLERIEQAQLDAHDEMLSHQLNDTQEFSKIERRDAEAAKSRVRIEETLKGLATKEDMEAIKPLLEAMAGGKIAITWGRVIYKIFLALGSVAMAYLAIKRL